MLPRGTERFLACTCGIGWVKASKFDGKTDYRAHMPQFKEEAYDQNAKLLALIGDMAKAKGASNAQISLAWMMNKKPYIVPIPGSHKLKCMKENFDASKILLNKEEVDSLDEALAYSGMLAVFGGSKLKNKQMKW